MYARTVSFDAPTDHVDAGIHYARDEVMPEVTGMPGCLGMSVVADHTSGRCISTTAWQSLDDLRASEDRVRPMRERGADIFGTSPTVEEWELVAMHREHTAGEGACVRATWLQGAPSDVDHDIEVFRNMTLPEVQEFDGFCSASLLVDRTTGRCVASFAYEDQASMRASRQRADDLRTRTASEMRAGVTDVREFDYALMHLHAPELV